MASFGCIYRDNGAVYSVNHARNLVLWDRSRDLRDETFVNAVLSCLVSLTDVSTPEDSIYIFILLYSPATVEKSLISSTHGE